MEIPKTQVIFNRKGKVNRDGKGLVQIMVYSYRLGKATRKYFSTGVYVEPEYWKNYQVENHRYAYKFNRMITDKKQEIEDFIMQEGESFTFDKLDMYLDGTYGSTFNSFMSLEIESNNTVTDHHLDQHRATLGHLNKFQKDIGFKQITYEFVKRFDVYLRKQNFKDSTLYGHHKRFRRYVNESVKHGYVRPQDDPYRSFRLKTVRSQNVKYLEEAQLVTLRDHDFSNHPKFEKVRDFYVFCCYTGLAYQDAAILKKADILEEDGTKYIKNPRLKTDEQSMIVLFDPAIEILERYNYKLPVISNQKTNDYLKIIAEAVGIGLNLTTHTARHTCAVLLINKGMRMETLARWLGHSTPKTTMDRYAKVLKTTVRNEASEVSKLLK